MSAPVIRLDPAGRGRAFARCREVVEAGGIIAFPTDTFYGLGADPKNARAVRRLFEVKGRESGRPVLLLLADRSAVGDWVLRTTPAAEELMDRWWPGPLTLVLPARPEVLPELTAGTGTIGLRVPGNGLTRALLEAVGGALTGTSANRSGGPAPSTADEVAASLGTGIDLVLDAGPAPGGLPSTVVDATGDRPRLIRAGAVTFDLPTDRTAELNPRTKEGP